jgi:hypothetical protein
MKTFRKKIRSKNSYKEYVRILNGILGLSNREMELFYLLLEINDTNKPVLGSYQNILSTDIRRAIMKETRVNKSNLVKYINALVDKRILIKSDDGYILNEFFKPIIDTDKLLVNFELIIDNETNLE